MSVQAIETTYAGCRFRSRLEARWAVFFDRVGARWLYEPQGYVVAGRPYLPDFWLPDFRLWTEVKGCDDNLDLGLLVNATIPHEGLPASPAGDRLDDPSRAGRRLLILGPIPRPSGRAAHSVLTFHKGDVRRQWLEFNSYDVHVGLREDLIGTDAGDLYPPTSGLATPMLLGGYPHPYVDAAYAAARSARFEHGQSGA